jgi:hypothetical protein
MLVPPFKNNEGFYDIPVQYPKPPHKIWNYYGLYNDRLELIKDNIKMELFKGSMSAVEGFSIKLYDKKYYVYNMVSQTLDTFDFKFKTPCHRLTISYGKLFNIISLPKELLTLYLFGSSPLLKFPKKLPKNLVSLTFVATAFPFNGRDLSYLTKLKVLRCGTSGFNTLPKLPKSIMYLECNRSSLTRQSLLEFNIKDYPNLIYFGIPKECGRLPDSLIQAKKSGKLKIIRD